jgi:hypothetical protein
MFTIKTDFLRLRRLKTKKWFWEQFFEALLDIRVMRLFEIRSKRCGIFLKYLETISKNFF